MAEERKQQPQQAHDAQQAPDFVVPSRDKMPAELAELMQLSFAEIEQLPEEKQQLVYAEIGRQIAENTQLQEQLDAMAANFKKLIEVPKETAEALRHILNRWEEGQKEWQRRWEALQRQYDFSKLAETMQQLAEVGPTLQPYIDRIYNADPERWGNASIPEMYAAAAKAAREDGQEVPPLWFEQTGEQLAMQLDIPGEQAASKEESGLTPAELLETIKTVQAIDPAAHVMPNNALMNALTQKPAINAGAFDLVVANEQARRKEITNYTIVNYDPGDSGITITDPKLSEYERQVSDAVISLWAEAKRQNMPPLVTDDMIYRAMPGGGERPQPAQRAAITRTMEKLRRLHIYMDATEEMQKRGKIGASETFVIDDYYINFARGQYKAQNSRQKITGYMLKADAPIMLTYSQMTGQLLTVQAKYLEIRKVKGGNVSPELIPATAGRQAMAGYMLRRIAVMRHDEEAARDALRQYNKRRKKETDLEAKPLAAFRKQSRVILFDTIFTEAGTATADRKQAGLNRAYCYEVLEYWQATGLIKGYAEQRKGKKITGFSVTV